MDVPAHGEVDEDEHVELDEDGEGEEDGVHDEADQAQSPVQSPVVQMDTENLQASRADQRIVVGEIRSTALKSFPLFWEFQKAK